MTINEWVSRFLHLTIKGCEILVSALRVGSRFMRDGLFIPWHIDQRSTRVRLATADLLANFGAEVDFPTEQTYSSQPLPNAGRRLLFLLCQNLILVVP